MKTNLINRYASTTAMSYFYRDKLLLCLLAETLWEKSKRPMIPLNGTSTASLSDLITIGVVVDTPAPVLSSIHMFRG